MWLYNQPCTVEGCNFEFQCLPQYVLLGTGPLGNTTVVCSKQGDWMFGDLHCQGKCKHWCKAVSNICVNDDTTQLLLLKDQHV